MGDENFDVNTMKIKIMCWRHKFSCEFIIDR